WILDPHAGVVRVPGVPFELGNAVGVLRRDAASLRCRGQCAGRASTALERHVLEHPIVSVIAVGVRGHVSKERDAMLDDDRRDLKDAVVAWLDGGVVPAETVLDELVIEGDLRAITAGAALVGAAE